MLPKKVRVLQRLAELSTMVTLADSHEEWSTVGALMFRLSDAVNDCVIGSEVQSEDAKRLCE